MTLPFGVIFFSALVSLAGCDAEESRRADTFTSGAYIETAELKGVKMMTIIQGSKIDFLSKRKIAAVLSVVIGA